MRTDRRALAVLIVGACIIGVGPILVRWAQAGPAATAFWRLMFALPLMALLAARQRASGQGDRPTRFMLLAGVLFAADIVAWHYGLHLTSVTNATVLSNLTPILVTVAAWLLYRERPSRLFLGALLLAVGGCIVMGAAKGSGGLGVDPPLGNALSTLAAVFYGGYFLFVRQARATAGAVSVMLWSGLVSAPLVLGAAVLLREPLVPAGAIGWAAVAGLGLMHVTGQGAIAWSLGRLPTALAAVAVLVQPVVAALLGWWLLGERVTPLQALGGAVVLAGVALAQVSGRRRAGPASSPEVADSAALSEDRSSISEQELGRARTS